MTTSSPGDSEPEVRATGVSAEVPDWSREAMRVGDWNPVTLGSGGPVPLAPVLAGHVDIGAGAKVLGGVTIGAHAVIGANAVVLSDVPAGATAVGIPARIVTRAVAGEPTSATPK